MLTLVGVFTYGVLPRIVAAAKAVHRPNIILIMADDLGYGSLGCYGSKEVRTPNIDRLADKGIRLTDFHSNGPMCTPTRAALMTGRYPQRCVWVDDEELSPVFQEQRRKNMKQRWAWGISLSEITIADLLKQADYRTALIGKWHLGYDFRFHPMNHGFDEFQGYVGGAVDYHSHVAIHGLMELDWWRNKQIENEKGYTTDLLTKYATSFIGRHKDVPFFLYVAHEAPHTPLQGRDPTKKQSPADTYREMIEVMDESVGKVEAALREHRLEKKTLVIFCSDNGPASPRGCNANGVFRGNKGSMYEAGHRVPCIISWPGVLPAHSVCNEPVLTMDFFPTFTKLAGVTPSADHKIDGIDIMPLVRDNTEGPDRALHWLFGDTWAVRNGPWKLMGTSTTAKTLVNLEDDPGESQNFCGKLPERVKELTKLHNDWVEDVGLR